MSPADTARLLLLSSLWGFSFIFMRVAAPEFGPVSLIGVRVGLGAGVGRPQHLGRTAALLQPALQRGSNGNIDRYHAGPGQPARFSNSSSGKPSFADSSSLS